MGDITEVVRRYVPASYRAMVGSTNTYYSGDDLQALASFVEQRLFATVVTDPTQELATFGIEKTELLGMLTTLQFIPAAVEYWGDQLASESTTGTNETVTYYDRRDQLWKLFAKIQADAAQLAIDIGVNVTSARAIVPKVSQGDNHRHLLRTPDPHNFPRQSRTPLVSDWLPWGAPTDVSNG